MSIARYEPWTSLNHLHREINRLFDTHDSSDSSAVADWVPAVDIYEYDDRFELLADLPGVNMNDLEITLENGLLSLIGQRAEVDENGVQRSRRERSQGRFHRRFTLPDTADVENVSARSDAGILTVSIPKRAQAKPVRVKVQH